tara:strand:+ start:4044 stop:5741 length:1698 start_codon:yes stop_codon:yes gene_type:complete
MAIKRYIANADNTITNAFDASLNGSFRATGSNMGESDILEAFSIYGQASGSAGQSSELSRILIKFPVDTIITDRTANTIPASGSVSFFLRMYNAKHSETLPRNYTMIVTAVSQSWEEGYGLDMVNYTDKTYDGFGSNWIMASSGSKWNNATTGNGGSTRSPAGNVFGGVYHDSPEFKQTFDRGHEDLEIDITHLVEQWIGGENTGTGNENTRKLNYGVGVAITSSQEAYTQQTVANKSYQNLTGAVRSYYTKRFFARNSEFFFKRPCIEARWDSSRKDESDKFNYWSPLAENADNINTIYFYNYVNGQLKNIPSSYLTNNKILVSLYSGSHANTRPLGSRMKLKSSSYSALGYTPIAATNDLNATGGLTTTTGIYSCSLALTGADSGSLTNLFAVWHNKDGFVAGTNRFEFHTSSLTPSNRKPSNVFPPGNRYVTSMPSLRNSYHKDETARFRIHTRQKNWNPNIYTKASSTPELSHIEDAYFKVSRIADNMTVIDYGTGSATTPQDLGTAASCTRLSYDVSGSYFDLDMNLLEPGYAYGIKFVYYLNSSYMEQPEEFKFRVEDT